MIFRTKKGFPILRALVASGVSVNKNRMEIIEYLDKNKTAHLSKISQDLKIDYKNLHRYIKELENIKIVSVSSDSIKGKKVFVSLNENFSKGSI